MHELTEFPFPTPAERRTGAIWSWWERRRLAYNVWVGTAGTFSVVACTALALLPPRPMGPMSFDLIWVPVVIFDVLANVFYTTGAGVETLADKLWGRQIGGPLPVPTGLTFSVGLALFPTLNMLIGWILRVLGTVG